MKPAKMLKNLEHFWCCRTGFLLGFPSQAKKWTGAKYFSSYGDEMHLLNIRQLLHIPLP